MHDADDQPGPDETGLQGKSGGIVSAHASRDEASISGEELDGLFAVLARHCRLLLAVSGGADSLALLVLVAEWCRRGRARAVDGVGRISPQPAVVPLVRVATVDHGLRAASAAEARVVAAHAARLGLEHATLVVPERLGPSRLAAEARAARYGLLAAHARAIGAGAVVTAHHLDDQAETVMMRLVRGSGVDGLAGMRSEQPMHWGRPVPSPVGSGALEAASDIVLVRPLIGVERRRLVASLTARGIDDWVDDPSNTDQRFERARVRKALEVLEGLGLAAPSISRLAERAGRASATLERLADDWIACQADVVAGYARTGIVRLARAALSQAGDETALRVLGRGLAAAGGGARSSLTQREEVLAAVLGGQTGRLTVGGCVLLLAAEEVVIGREVGRMGSPRLVLAPGAAGLWDGRCMVRRPPCAPGRPGGPLVDQPCEITPMTKEAWQGLRAAHAQVGVPVWRDAACLPLAVFADGSLAAPSVGIAVGPDGSGLAMDAMGLDARFVGLVVETARGGHNGA